MTDDLERLEALARAATPGPYRMSPWHVEEGPPCVRLSNGPSHIIATTASDADAAFIAAAHPSATLSLIKRVREADRLLKIENGIRALAQQNFENMKQYSEDAYDNGRKAGHAAGRAEALEEAAKVAMTEAAYWQAVIKNEGWHVMRAARADEAMQIAAAIRALGEKAG